MFEFLMGLSDHCALSGNGGEASLHLSQLIQVAVFGLCLQLQLLLLKSLKTHCPPFKEEYPHSALQVITLLSLQCIYILHRRV